MSNEEIIAAINAGGNRQQLMGELWQQNKGLIYKIANQYSGLSEFDDLTQTGFLGLDAAARHYDASAGANFATYAVFWIKQAMQRYLDNCGTVVRLPVKMREKVSQYQKAREELTRELGREPNIGKLCRKLRIYPEALEDIQKAASMTAAASLDKPIDTGDSTGGTLEELTPDRRNDIADAENRLYHEQLAHDLWDCVDSLPDKQPDVLRARYQQGATLEQTAELTGISKENARCQERRALNALRYGKNRARLSPYYDEIRSAAMRGVGVERFRTTWTSATEYTAMRLWD